MLSSLSTRVAYVVCKSETYVHTQYTAHTQALSLRVKYPRRQEREISGDYNTHTTPFRDRLRPLERCDGGQVNPFSHVTHFDGGGRVYGYKKGENPHRERENAAVFS